MEREKQLLELLDGLRSDVDAADDAIQDILLDRQHIVGHISLIKTELNLPPHQPGRFAHIMERLQTRADFIGLRNSTVEAVWGGLHQDSISAQIEQRSEAVPSEPVEKI
jgi:chorismate mutase